MNIRKYLPKHPFIRHIVYWIFLIFTIFIASHLNWWVENIYFKWIYQAIAVANRMFDRLFSFSIGDVFYILLSIYIFYLLVNLISHIRKPTEALLKISRFLLLIIGLFYLSWGFNYFRPSIDKTLKFSSVSYNLHQLTSVTDTVIKRANALQLSLSGNDTSAVDVPYGLEHILNKTPTGYEKIALRIKQKYREPVIKKSLLSPFISYLYTTGYLNPYSGEAHINYLYPKFAVPFIASHEVAHQLGYAPEDEANFLGYLAAIHHPDPYFQYSGYTAALYYLLLELKKADKKLYQEKIIKLNKGILKNFAEEARFYRKYKNKYDMSQAYDSYLKLNKQKKGIRSYNDMLKLLIGYYVDKDL